MADDNSNTGDRAAQKARADAIRRLRDDRRAKIDKTAPAPSAPAPPGPDKPADTAAPNYAEFVDRKMRERKKSAPDK
jgi:hypothetical protein